MDFSNTVICMTSNAGSSEQTGSGLGFNTSAVQAGREKAMKALREFLRPEFLGRVDEVVCFDALSEEKLRRIAALMMEEYRPGMEQKGITYSYTDAALDLLADKAEGGRFGARDLRRVIRKQVEDKVADKIVSGEVAMGGSLTVDAENGEIVLR